MKKSWILALGLALLTSCGSKIPDNIIQPNKMEAVLYDYHLSMGMSVSLKYSENYKKEAYKKYVFQKHQITEELFDSSMVWYTRNAMELATIYANLEKRFNREHNHHQMLLERHQIADTRTTQPGDTVDIWGKRSMYWLSASPVFNLLTFEIKADTNFRPKDAFLWNADYHLLPKGKVTIGLNVVYDNDSVIGETKVISQTGTHSIYLHTDSAYKVSALNGFIHVLPEDSVADMNVLVNHISLIRYHAANDSTQVAADTSGSTPLLEKANLKKVKANPEKEKTESSQPQDKRPRHMETLQLQEAEIVR